MIVPDYAPPSALMVPHAPFAIRGVLEAIAEAAADHVGVILLSSDPDSAGAFIARQADPARFSVVGADFDTPWIRDRAPIAVRDGRDYRWVLPRLPKHARPLDDVLFRQISARPVIQSPLLVAQGNLVAGPEGVVVSTDQILRQNGISHIGQLTEAAGQLGVRRWIVFPPLREELSGHADVHLRFLAPDLFAVAWNPQDEGDQTVARRIEARVRQALPHARSLRVPMRRHQRDVASLVNWIQVGRDLLVPRFSVTPQADLAQTSALLGAAGYRCRFIASPTVEFGGSLHCLTASIHVAEA